MYRVIRYRSDLGLTLANVALVLGNMGRRDDALAAIRESIDEHRAAVERAQRVSDELVRGTHRVERIR